jgi:hypothetical protein
MGAWEARPMRHQWQGKRVHGNLGQRETGHARFELFLFLFFYSLTYIFSILSLPISSSSYSRAARGLIPFLLFVLPVLKKALPSPIFIRNRHHVVARICSIGPGTFIFSLVMRSWQTCVLGYLAEIVCGRGF